MAGTHVSAAVICAMRYSASVTNYKVMYGLQYVHVLAAVRWCQSVQAIHQTRQRPGAAASQMQHMYFHMYRTVRIKAILL